jgi:hypothetical protein
MTAYLSPDCVLFFGGMGAPASQGIEAVVTDLKKVLTYWQLIERRVLAEGLSADGNTVFAAMNNRLSILGQHIELPETEVEKVEAALGTLKRKMPADAFSELVAVAPQFPTWLAQAVGTAAYG